MEKNRLEKYTYLSFLSIFLICLATATLEKNRQEKYTYLSFLSVFFHLPSYATNAVSFGKNRQEKKIVVRVPHLLPTGTLGNTDKRNIPICLSCLFITSAFLQVHWEIQTREIYLFVFLVCLSHLPSYRYTGKYRQEKYTYLSFLSVYHICLPTGTLGNTDKRNIPICLSCLFFSSAFQQVHWEIQTREIYLFVFLVCFSHLPSYRYTGKYRQEKYTYLSFLSVYHICLPTGTLGNTDKRNIPICLSCLFITSAFLQVHWEIQTREIYLFVFLVCFSHLPSYRYTGKYRQEKYTYLSFLSVYHICLPTGTLGNTDKRNIPICLSCLFITSAFLQVHWEIQTREIYLFVFLVCLSHLPSYRYTGKYRQEKYTYLSFLSVYHICLPTGTLRKTDKKNTPICLSCLFS